MKQFPLARQEQLVIEELSEEVLVYDLNTNKAHCLNKTAALIWKNCDGQKSAREIAATLKGQLEAPVQEEAVKFGLEELSAYGLLVDELTRKAKRGRVSRRELIKKLGLSAAVGLPLIISITAPTAAHAQSPVPPDPCVADPGGIGCPCAVDGQCNTQNCNAGECGPEL